MKITELDFTKEGKRYRCGNSMFAIKNGDLLDVETYTYLKDSCIPVAELVEMEFEEIKEMKNPYTRVVNREKYCTIEKRGNVGFIQEDGHYYDNELFSIANYFNNKEYAEYIAFKETLMRKLDKFAWDHNAKAIDWGNGVTKYYIIFSHIDNELIVRGASMYMANNIIYFTSKETAEKAIEEFKEDLIKLHTWRFDV